MLRNSRRACLEAHRAILPLLIGSTAAAPASAAGVDSRNYACIELQALIQQHGFVFLGNPDFQDFVVAGQDQCGISSIVRWRSVPTKDQPECIVNFCVGGRGSGPGG